MSAQEDGLLFGERVAWDFERIGQLFGVSVYHQNESPGNIETRWTSNTALLYGQVFKEDFDVWEGL